MLTLNLYRSRRLTRRGPVREWRWHLRASNHRKISNGGQGYGHKNEARVYALLAIGGTFETDVNGNLNVRRMSDTVEYRENGDPVPAEDHRVPPPSLS